MRHLNIENTLSNLIGKNLLIGILDKIEFVSIVAYQRKRCFYYQNFPEKEELVSFID